MPMYESVVSMPVCASAYEYHRRVWELVRKTPDDIRAFLFCVRSNGRRAFVKIRSPLPLLQGASAMEMPVKGGRYRFSMLLTIEPRQVPGGWVTAETAKAWLDRRLADRGMDAEQVRVEFLSGMPFGKTEHDWSFRRVEASGILTVRDAELAGRALLMGVGRAKGFGFGLIELSEWSEAS